MAKRRIKNQALTIPQILVRRVLPIVLAVVLLTTGGVILCKGFFKDDPVRSDVSANGVSIPVTEATVNATEADEVEDDLTVKLTKDELRSLYGEYLKKYVLVSSFLSNASVRSKLDGFDDGVSIPMFADQCAIDAARKDKNDEQFVKYLDEAAKTWKSNWAKLSKEDKEFRVREGIRQEILLNPVFGDMMSQALLTIPAVKKDNPWASEFKAAFDEAYNRSKDEIPNNEQLLGIEAFVHYADADAKESGDLTKLKVNTECSEDSYAYFENAAKITALIDGFFSYAGEQQLKSTKNWHMAINGEPALQRTEQANYQESLTVHVFEHRNKNGDVTIKIGFNMQDRRIEIFDPEEPTVPKITTAPPSGSNPPSTTIVTTKTTVKTTTLTTAITTKKTTAKTTKVTTIVTTTKVTTKTTAPDGGGAKDPSKDPENRPGYNPGIGNNRPDDGPGVVQPTSPPKVDYTPVTTAAPKPYEPALTPITSAKADTWSSPTVTNISIDKEDNYGHFDPGED